VSNHPKAGGSHLPDITVITPVFHPRRKLPVFYVANRGHHADIGGTTPGFACAVASGHGFVEKMYYVGSMPPNSQSLAEEGASIKSFKLVKQGLFQEEGITEHLMSPAKRPGCSGPWQTYK
jgi:5-oxoprolinase (ATP-hydrolysing)